MRAREVWERWFVERGELGAAAARELVLSLGEIRDRILEGARLAPGARVVDVGCGRGLLAFGAADAVGRDGAVVGVDVAAEPLAAVRPLARDAGVALVRGDVRRLPLATGWADAVVWRSVLVYMERRRDALAEARRVLRPGGVLSFSESLGAELDVRPNDTELVALWGALKEIAAAALGEMAFTVALLEGLVGEAGFEAVRVRPERRRTRLPDARTARAFFEEAPPGGLSLADLWRAAGVPRPVVDSFLAGLAGSVPHLLETPEAYVTARNPSGDREESSAGPAK